MYLDGEDYVAMSAPVDDPDSTTFFSVDTAIQARYIAYYSYIFVVAFQGGPTER